MTVKICKFISGKISSNQSLFRIIKKPWYHVDSTFKDMNKNNFQEYFTLDPCKFFLPESSESTPESNNSAFRIGADQKINNTAPKPGIFRKKRMGAMS